MREKTIAWLIVLSFFVVLSGLTGCAKNAYFGVKNKAVGVPDDFAQTEAAIEKAESSSGAQYAPEKIAKARELAKKGVGTYWGCRTKEAKALLADARNLAKEAELAKAPPKPAPKPVAKPAPPRPPKPVAKPAKVPPAPPAVPKAVAVAPVTKKVIILIGVNFAFDSAELTSQTRAMLDEHATLLKKESFSKVQVAGHTDSIGPEDYNEGLSEKRAKTVMEYLASKGIPREKLEAAGYGESRPIDTNDTREGREKNRRVTLRMFD
jgi:outer membrane protein OmpA-like peptidoglycan-associated protein